MSLVASLVAEAPRLLLGAAVLFAPFCVQRERILVGLKGAAPSEHTRWSLVSPLGGGTGSDVRAFNRVIYDAIADRPVGSADSAAPLVVVRENATPWPLTLFGAVTSARESFVVPHEAIDGDTKYPNFGKGGLVEAAVNDTWFFNRLCRYRE